MLCIFQITGLLLNTSHTYCPSCSEPHYLFGSPDRFRTVASQLGAPVLGELPLVSDVSTGGDAGVPYMLTSSGSAPVTGESRGRKEWRDAMNVVAERVWRSIDV
jgi:ATP-binding protein involved in chromosome partitioning